jgi:segregation and condensation protein A
VSDNNAARLTAALDALESDADLLSFTIFLIEQQCLRHLRLDEEYIDLGFCAVMSEDTRDFYPMLVMLACIRPSTEGYSARGIDESAFSQPVERMLSSVLRRYEKTADPHVGFEWQSGFFSCALLQFGRFYFAPHRFDDGITILRHKENGSVIALLPDEEVQIDDELADLSAEETRDILVARLIAYKQYKNVAAMLGARMESTDHMHPRTAGPEAQFLNLLPDYLENVTLQGLAVMCADIAARRSTFLLEAEHIAALPISLELHAKSVRRMVFQKRHTTFTELCGETRDPAVIVVTFLAVLELFKRGVVTMKQTETFGTLEVDYLGDPSMAIAGSLDEDDDIAQALADNPDESEGEPQ